MQIKRVQFVEANVFLDQRGTFHRAIDVEWGIPPILQVSIATNNEIGTLRGMHALERVKEEFKVVTCIQGSALDCVVDLRPESPDFKQIKFFTLDSSVPGSVIIPPGCTHGYVTTSPNTTLIYGMSAIYDSSAEVGIRWDDPGLGINWPVQPQIVSEKDLNYPLLKASPQL